MLVLVSDPNVRIVLNNSAPGLRERVMPNDHYERQKKDCESFICDARSGSLNLHLLKVEIDWTL